MGIPVGPVGRVKRSCRLEGPQQSAADWSECPCFVQDVHAPQYLPTQNQVYDSVQLVSGQMAEQLDAITFAEARSVQFFFRGQLLHALAALILAAIAWALASPSLGGGTWLGITDEGWFWATVGLSVVHQVYGWLVFRGQLGWGVFTRWFG